VRAAILRRGEIVVDDVPEPVPGPGQVLVETIACGICGSDLHCRLHAHDFVAAAKASGMSVFDFDPDADLVFGHEFAARVVGLGPGVAGVVEGVAVVGHPVVVNDHGVRSVGYANELMGGFAQRMVLEAPRLLPVPNGLDPRHAALTEPMAVGRHAVNASWVGRTRSAVVVGCGPVGLAVLASLRAAGVPLVVAADFSPARRALAERMGAHVVVDPATTDAVEAWSSAGGRGATVVFEAVGVPGLIDRLLTAIPRNSQILVVGLCMQHDQLWPAVAVNKEATISFVLGWTPDEFRDSLADLAEGRIDVAPLVTADVGLDGVAGAFEELANPERHAKVLVRPNA
jgi:2-desacetyl-2-hydroxyethyl bacteriochlorophyllide A dehydrogenase